MKDSVQRVSRFGVVGTLLTLVLSACASKVVSPVQPSAAQLSCSSGEGPIAERYYQGTFKWVCGPLPCPADQEAVWKPISGSEATAGFAGLRSAAGVQKVSFTCASHCDSGDPRRPDGECPGTYFLNSRVEQNTLILTAVVIPPGSHASPGNFKPTSSRENYLRTPGVVITIDDDRVQRPSATTDAKGEARFDLASEPFRHLVDSTDLISFSATGQFKDGSKGRTMAVSTLDSQLAQEARARKQAELDAKRKEHEAAQAGEDAKRRELESQCSSGKAESCYAVAMNLCWPGFWPGDAERPDMNLSYGSACSRVLAWSQALPYFHKACELNHQPGCARESKLQAEQAETKQLVQQQRACESGCYDDQGKPRRATGDSPSKANSRLVACKKACDSPLCTRNPTSMECRMAQQAAWMSVK